MASVPAAGAARVGKPARSSWRTPFIKPGVRAKLAMGLLALTMIVSAVSIWNSVEYLNLFARVQGGQDVTEEEGESIDSTEGIIGLAGLVVWPASLVFFFLWEYRVYKNLMPLGATQIRFSPGGSVGWYFCPIVSLWKPCQAMNDIWLGSVGSGGSMVGLWWIIWLGDIIINQASFRMMMSATRAVETLDLDRLSTAYRMSIAGDVSSIVGGVFTLALIGMITSGQTRRMGSLQARPAAGDIPPMPY